MLKCPRSGGQASALQSVFRASLRKCFWISIATVCPVLCFHFCHDLWLNPINTFFEKSPQKSLAGLGLEIVVARYFHVKIHIAKYFKNSSKRFRCEVMFDNEHTFCSCKYHVRICTAFAQLTLAAAYRLGWPWSSVMGEVGRVCCAWGMDLLLISFLYRHAWLLFGCVSNGTLCIRNFRFYNRRKYFYRVNYCPIMVLIACK
jgi:hypothetical protein